MKPILFRSHISSRHSLFIFAMVATLLAPVARVHAAAVATPPATVIAEKLDRTFTWNAPDDEKRYGKQEWHRITTSRLQGFLPTVFVEKKSDGCPGATPQRPALRRFGAFCPNFFWLEEQGRSKRSIDSMEKLKARFTPIASEALAVSFVGVTQSDLKVTAGDILEGHVLTISDGYLVQAVVGNSLGCSQHEPFGVIFKVLKNGEISRIALEPEPKSNNPVICVD